MFKEIYMKNKDFQIQDMFTETYLQEISSRTDVQTTPSNNECVNDKDL